MSPPPFFAPLPPSIPHHCFFSLSQYQGANEPGITSPFFRQSPALKRSPCGFRLAGSLSLSLSIPSILVSFHTKRYVFFLFSHSKCAAKASPCLRRVVYASLFAEYRGFGGSSACHFFSSIYALLIFFFFALFPRFRVFPAPQAICQQGLSPISSVVSSIIRMKHSSPTSRCKPGTEDHCLRPSSDGFQMPRPHPPPATTRAPNA